MGLQGSECSEWFQSAQGARRWRSCLGGVAVADWQNSPDQVSGRQPNPMHCLQIRGRQPNSTHCLRMRGRQLKSVHCLRIKGRQPNTMHCLQGSQTPCTVQLRGRQPDPMHRLHIRGRQQHLVLWLTTLWALQNSLCTNYEQNASHSSRMPCTD